MRIDRAMRALQAPDEQHLRTTMTASANQGDGAEADHGTGVAMISGGQGVAATHDEGETGIRSELYGGEQDIKSRAGHSHGGDVTAINIVDQQRRCQTRSGTEYMQRRRRVANPGTAINAEHVEAPLQLAPVGRKTDMSQKQLRS